MRVLLLGVDSDPIFDAWRGVLERAGVPHDAVLTGERDLPPLLSPALDEARYQAVIVATAAVLEESLDAGAQAAFAHLLGVFGVRRLIAYAYPGERYGLHSPGAAGPLDGIEARLTDRGHELFPYLRGPVPLDAGTWGYRASPLSSADFDVLLSGPDGSALLGLHRHGGIEEMVQVFAGAAGQMQTLLLSHGQLAWVTRGIYLGFERDYLSLHVDDVLLASARWSVSGHVTPQLLFCG